MTKIDYSQVSQESSWDANKHLQEAAYYNWLNAGCPADRDVEFWAEAERQIFGYTSEEYYDEMEEIIWDDGFGLGMAVEGDVYV